LDQVGEGFLKEYYPDALEKPMEFPTLKIAETMGLCIQEIHITKTTFYEVFGQSFPRYPY
jgi:hypothetical protein